MDISQFSNRCVYIPPVKTDYVLSQTQQEEIKTSLEHQFTQLRDSGIEVVLCIGGMNLDYARYDVSHIIPCIMIYHTMFQYYEEIENLYENTTLQTIQSEFAYANNQYSFLEAIIYHDARTALQQELQQNSEYNLLLPEIEVDVPKLIAKYVGIDLLTNWLKEQKVLVGYNIQNQLKELKQPFNSNKAGLKIDMTQSKKEIYICGNIIREDIVF